MKTGKLIVGLAVLVFSLVIISSMTSAMTLQATTANIGSGSKYTAVAYGNGTFVEVWYNYTGSYMNVTVINSTTGAVVATGVLTRDVYTYNGAPSIKPAIVHVPGTDTFVIAWVNSSNYLEAIGVNNTLAVTFNETTINDTTGVSYKGIAMGVGGDKVFFVWSDSSYHLEGRFMNGTYNGTVFRISNFNSEQKNPWIAYDPVTNNFMVTWINHTGYYNITGKIFNANTMAPITGDIIIANAYADQSSYTAPAVSGGAGEFFVTYVTYNSPYNITGKIYDAYGNLSAGPFLIGATYKYGKSPMPSVFDGNTVVVTWSNATESILARTYTINGTPSQNTQIIYNSTNGGNPAIAYDDDNGAYFFSWSEYMGSGNPYGINASLWTSGEFVPEFNFVLPAIGVVFAGVFLLRRKH